ncbi:MAG: hypothetical protein ACHP7K_02925 [Actinomycetales bacterium]|jgi:hypothetical protein
MGENVAQITDGSAPEMVVILAGGAGRLTIGDDGICRLSWGVKEEIGLEAAVEVQKALLGLSAGEPMLLLLNISGVTVSREARLFFPKRALAAAVAVVGESMPDRVVSASLLRGLRRPHRYFTVEADAREWLKTFGRSRGGGDHCGSTVGVTQLPSAGALVADSNG